MNRMPRPSRESVGMDATAEVEFHETPLSEVVGFLRETYKIPVVINNRALDDVGLGTETPVTMSLRGSRCDRYCISC